MSAVPGPYRAVPAPPHHQGNGNTHRCDHCHKLLFGTKPGGQDVRSWVKAKMCDCAPFDEFACACSCGRAPTTHVVDVASMRLVPWCGRRQCKRVAAMSYRWPQEWKDTPPSIEVQGCAGCGQQPSDGPWARKDEEFAAMSCAYGFLWVDHWCTRGCADIPRLRSVYQQSDKVVLPMDGERPVSVVRLVVLFIAWCFLLPPEMALLVVGALGDACGRAFVQQVYNCKQCRVLSALARLLAATLLSIASGAVYLLVWCPLVLTTGSVGLCLRFVAECKAPRSKRLWLRMESVYTRTHAVLLPSGLNRSLRWRMSIEVLAREWRTWLRLSEGRAHELSKCDVYSVSDRLLVELLSGLDVDDFVLEALEAAREAEAEGSNERDPSLPRWLPSKLGALYKPDTLMGCVIEAKYIPGAAVLTIADRPHLLIPPTANNPLVSIPCILKLRHEPETGTFAVVPVPPDVDQMPQVDHYSVCAAHVTCRRLSPIVL